MLQYFNKFSIFLYIILVLSLIILFSSSFFYLFKFLIFFYAFCLVFCFILCFCSAWFSLWSAMGGQSRAWTPHKRRGPIAAEFSGPGPAAIALPSLFGSKFWFSLTNLSLIFACMYISPCLPYHIYSVSCICNVLYIMTKNSNVN